MLHEITWIEIICGDIAASSNFYRELFGWQIENMGEAYAGFNPGSGPQGGFSRPMPSLEQGCCLYISCEDIEAMLDRIGAAGGEILVRKTSIGEHGFYGLFKDPHGTVMGLWSKH
jgi:uncharacterized protein